jgi:hypothetical protein
MTEPGAALRLPQPTVGIGRWPIGELASRLETLAVWRQGGRDSAFCFAGTRRCAGRRLAAWWPTPGQSPGLAGG